MRKDRDPDPFDWPDEVTRFELHDTSKRISEIGWTKGTARLFPRRKSAAPAWDAFKALRDGRR